MQGPLAAHLLCRGVKLLRYTRAAAQPRLQVLQGGRRAVTVDGAAQVKRGDGRQGPHERVGAQHHRPGCAGGALTSALAGQLHDYVAHLRGRGAASSNKGAVP